MTIETDDETPPILEESIKRLLVAVVLRAYRDLDSLAEPHHRRGAALWFQQRVPVAEHCFSFEDCIDLIPLSEKQIIYLVTEASRVRITEETDS